MVRPVARSHRAPRADSAAGNCTRPKHLGCPRRARSPGCDPVSRRLSAAAPCRQQRCLLAQAQAAFPATVDAVEQLQELVAGVEINEDGAIDVDGDRALFQATQAIIQGDVGAQVLYVTINGFDTHSLQGPKQDALLQLVANGLADLFTALEESGHAANTLALVVSEFGRRAAENGSLGTDHGRGGLSFMMGPPVAQSTLIGEPDLGDLVDGDLQITIDARSMYDQALRWLGASDETVVDVLGGEWNDLRILT
jgi:uncharacterized protein (DUF1501 family)